MSVQARFDKNDPRFYSANRDVAHNFKYVAKVVAAKLQYAEHWPVLNEHLKAHNVTLDELGDACRAFIMFVATSVGDPTEDMAGTLKRVGWEDVRDEARMALMAVLGTTMLGMYWAGARDATMGGDGPCASVDALVEAGEESFLLITKPKPFRRIRNWWRLRKQRRQLKSKPKD